LAGSRLNILFLFSFTCTPEYEHLVISCWALLGTRAPFKLISVQSPSESSPLIPNTGAASDSRDAPSGDSPVECVAFSPASPSDTYEAENESASDSATTEYHSFSDSDSEDDETAMTEEERKLEREVRAVERQLVLEAAGIVVKKDTTGRLPPHLQRRRTVAAVRPKHRPAPAPPPPSAPAATPAQPPDLGELVLPTRVQEHLDDAYERYEAFKQHSSRLSISSVDQLSPLPPASPSPGSGSFSFAPSQTRESHPDKERSKESVSTSSYGSRLSHFLARSRTPIQERETRVMPTISAPIMSASSSSGTVTLSSPTRGDSPGFGLVRGTLT
jgi:hypothetical protein